MELSIENLKKLLSQISSVGNRALDFKENESFDVQGVDSLDLLDYLLVIEETYGVEIPDEDLDQVSNLNDLIKYIKDRV